MAARGNKGMDILMGVAPIVLMVGAVAYVVIRNQRTRFPGCCTPPWNGRLWVCRHRIPWVRSGEHWLRLSRRRYIRLAVAELDVELGRSSDRH